MNSYNNIALPVQQTGRQPGFVVATNPARGHLINREICFFLSSFAHENYLVPRDRFISRPAQLYYRINIIHTEWPEVHGRVEGRRGRRGQTSPGEERGNETGKVVIAHGRSVEFCEATPIGLADESKESLYGNRGRYENENGNGHEDKDERVETGAGTETRAERRVGEGESPGTYDVIV